MTNPNTGSQPYGQDPNSYQPNTGSQSSYPQSGSQSYPQSGSQPAQSGYGDQYGTQQYGTQQYGQQGYGQQGYGQQYGQQGYGQQGYGQQGYGQGMPQYAGGFGGQQTMSRPGMATAAGVIGIIFGALGFFSSAYLLVVLTAGSESGAFGISGDGDAFLVMSFIAAVGWVVSSVLVFVGAIQILSGKNNKLIVISCIIYIVAQIVWLVGILTISEGEGIATVLVALIISLLLAGMLAFFAKNGDVENWLARKRAAEAAGYNG
ncbi:hypothetical protein [Epidermidibacterium keratini]|uniref:hypothetical protein n=1 Tax=Epidermidibacterium keratini TaxID=1891644 RepID=UPI0018659025|nr:hypothetical protein [Epidermidibacterium keratini]